MAIIEALLHPGWGNSVERLNALPLGHLMSQEERLMIGAGDLVLRHPGSCHPAYLPIAQSLAQKYLCGEQAAS